MIQNQNKSKVKPSLHTSRSPITLQLDRVRYLELICILKSLPKCKKSGFRTPVQGAWSCLQGARSYHQMSWDHARPCHRGARLCHSNNTYFSIFPFSAFHA